MGWSFFIKPHSAHEFSPKSISEMNDYLSEWPAAKRDDGCWILFESIEQRDEVMAALGFATTYESHHHIRPQSQRISIEVSPYAQDIPVVAKFIEWVLAKWPSDFYDEIERPFTVQKFLEEMAPR